MPLGALLNDNPALLSLAVERREMRLLVPLELALMKHAEILKRPPVQLIGFAILFRVL